MYFVFLDEGRRNTQEGCLSFTMHNYNHNGVYTIKATNMYGVASKSIVYKQTSAGKLYANYFRSLIQ